MNRQIGIVIANTSAINMPSVCLVTAPCSDPSGENGIGGGGGTVVAEPLVDAVLERWSSIEACDNNSRSGDSIDGAAIGSAGGGAGCQGFCVGAVGTGSTSPSYRSVATRGDSKGLQINRSSPAALFS
jgi:hypothetical protein